MRRFFYSLLLFFNSFFLLLVSACVVQQDVKSQELEISYPAGSINTVTITGWFTTIWNEEPHYAITDDEGQEIQLLMDEELIRPLGGPLALDRKRVMVIGEFVNDPQGTLQVRSIRFADGE